MNSFKEIILDNHKLNVKIFCEHGFYIYLSLTENHTYWYHKKVDIMVIICGKHLLTYRNGNCWVVFLI